ncbi:MAG TPA: two-component system VirA-like sensor kinase [Pseudolabrys sp.]|nr:two-component system VirA-like sensor kinase [Pseudolabrys sp.]
MRLLTGALGVLLLLGLLTWLLLRGIDTNAPAYAVTLRTFDDFALAEASLHRDVLQARAGLLRNYDTLVKAVEAMQDAVSRLRSHAQTEGLDVGPADRLAATVSQQEELTERFKSSNALLQNSLSYVGLLSTSPTFGAQDAQLAPATGALTAALLYLMRDTSPNAVKALQERIDQFAAQAPTAGPDAEAARALLAHSRLLQELIPAADETLKALVAAQSRQPLEELRARFADRRSAVEATAQRFRLLLYLVSLLLLVILVYLGLRLRSRALALRRRAAFDHVIAENSTRLINCSPAEIDARLKQVLAELSRVISVERAYVVLDESPTRAHSWSADGTAYPPGWPKQALTLSAQLATAGPDIVTVPDVAALPPGTLKDRLAAAGVRSWACVPLIRPGRARGIMGFDNCRPERDMVFPLPVLRLAGDAVANALEREFLERDRARLTTRLERARRMHMIGSLASGIAHNFNNIISAILGYSEIIEPQLTRGTKLAQHIDEIRQAAERGRDLIDSILTFGRQRDARVRPVQVRTLFEEASSLLRASLPSGVELVIDDVPTDVAVSGEPAQLQQVILNLCTNAAQAMPRSGSIRITAERKEVAAFLPMSHGELVPGRYVCLAVIDSGRGFDESVARRLFEPFFTTRSAGTGLGLATVHEIVREHDGAMNVQSKPEHGSRFEAWLPAVAADSSAVVGPAVLPLGRGETVLVVESERERLLYSEEMLAALGYEPVGFECLADAIAACRSAPDRFDIILVSNASQTSVGLDLTRALHEAAPRQPILLATSSTIDVGVNALADAGISDVLRRPLASTELAAALTRCLRSPGALQT